MQAPAPKFVSESYF